MSTPRNILVHLDTDTHPSAFDRIVALDAGADEVLSYGGVREGDIRRFVQDAIFTRGPKELAHTAIYIGGGDVAIGERLFAEARRHMLPNWRLQVSLMMDCNGCNTTAAAAVRSAGRHLELGQSRVVIFGGAGRVGRRIVALLVQLGAEVRIADVNQTAAHAVRDDLRREQPGCRVEAVPVAGSDAATVAEGRDLVFAAGPPGATLLPAIIPAVVHSGGSAPRVLIDLNAVPPLGIEGLEVGDKGEDRSGTICYGAIGIGDLKMKLHKRGIAHLFTRNDLALDLVKTYEMAGELD